MASGLEQVDGDQEAVCAMDKEGTDSIQASLTEPIERQSRTKWIDVFGNWLSNIEFIQLGPLKIAFRSAKP